MRFLFLLSFLLLGFPDLAFAKAPRQEKITSINIVNHNGMNETITEKDRLNGFNKINFLNPQPYQKVSRVFGRDKAGNIASCITSYHPNGQIKQYLEAVNNRALGHYREWHPNGALKIESFLIGGTADLNHQAEESWIFEGCNKAYDEEGHLLAEILYVKGELAGISRYYHKNGSIWKLLPFEKNLLHGTEKIYLEDGSTFQTTVYVKGKKDGLSYRHWSPQQLCFEELYKEGTLLEAKYYDSDGNLLSKIDQGFGFKAIFSKTALIELQEYRDGKEEGVHKILDKEGRLSKIYEVKNGEKHGEEIHYFSSQKPKLSLHWNEGMISGIFKTWYENGALLSQKEICQNKKNGLSTAWYENGALMLLEEYENDRLIKGEYFRKGESSFVSKVEKGKGFATLFDSNGNFLKKIAYLDGKPIE